MKFRRIHLCIIAAVRTSVQPWPIRPPPHMPTKTNAKYLGRGCPPACLSAAPHLISAFVQNKNLAIWTRNGFQIEEEQFQLDLSFVRGLGAIKLFCLLGITARKGKINVHATLRATLLVPFAL